MNIYFICSSKEYGTTIVFYVLRASLLYVLSTATYMQSRISGTQSLQLHTDLQSFLFWFSMVQNTGFLTSDFVAQCIMVRIKPLYLIIRRRLIHLWNTLTLTVHDREYPCDGLDRIQDPWKSGGLLVNLRLLQIWSSDHCQWAH